jgi:hypothetical protein
MKEMNNLYPILAFLDGVLSSSLSSSSSLEMLSVRSTKTLLGIGFLIVVDDLLVVWSMVSVLKVGWGKSRSGMRGVVVFGLTSGLDSALMQWLLDLDSGFGLTEWLDNLNGEGVISSLMIL